MAQPRGRRLRLVGGVQHVAGDTPPTSSVARDTAYEAGLRQHPSAGREAVDGRRPRRIRADRPTVRPMLLTPYAATALASRQATIALRHSRSGLSRRLRAGERVLLVDRRGGLHDGVVEDLAFTDDDVVYLLGPESASTAAPATSSTTSTASPARILDLDLARRRRAVREDGALR